MNSFYASDLSLDKNKGREKKRKGDLLTLKKFQYVIVNTQNLL